MRPSAQRVPLVHWLLVLACCIVVYWPRLGQNGFGATEGHRVIPAWTMLNSGNFFRVEMFGQPYLRKPPGMPWAIAASSAILGRTEFGARAVAAGCSTLMALAALWFGTRWYGRPYGLTAGVAQALAPLFVLGALTAEIEPLNALGTQLGALALIDLLIANPDSRASGHRRFMLLLCVIGIIIAALAKGPASAPVLGGVVAGACISTRSLRPLRDRALFGALALAATVLIPIYVLLRLNNPPSGAVVQDFSEFTWSRARLVGTLMLVPSALASAFPLSLALCFPWGRDARREAIRGAGDELSIDRGFVIAQSLAGAWFVSLGILFVVGVSNPRYGAPAAVLLPPLVAYVSRGLLGAAGRFEHSRRVFARCFMLGHPMVWPVLLLGLSLWWVVYDGAKPRHEEGRAAGSCIAAELPDGAEVWADDAIEARPDVLLYAQRDAARAGKTIEPRWMKVALRAGEVPGHSDPGRPVYLLLRQDEGSDEVGRLSRAQGVPALEQVAAAPVGVYRLFLFKLK